MLSTTTWLTLAAAASCVVGAEPQQSTNTAAAEQDLFTIEGKLVFVKTADTRSIDNIHTKISADGNQHIAFVEEDRESFTVSGVPPGSYLIEVYHPEFLFESVRVDVSSKGKIRARRPESLDNAAGGAQNNQLVYPLRLRLLRKATYFQAKEAWRITEMLMNPMVLMMVLPLVVLMVIPKMLQSVDPEAHKELQSTMSTMQQPNLSEMFNTLLSGTESKKTPAIKKSAERKDKRRTAD